MGKKEIWKDIPEYEGVYQVSDLGNIKGLHRTVAAKGSSKRVIYEKRLKSILRPDGYLNIHLCKNGTSKNFLIHQIVCAAFFGHDINGHIMVVNHINGNKLDNSLDNLEVVTTRENNSICFRENREKYTSKFIGVHWNRINKKWNSTIRINGKTKYLGSFVSEHDASNAYQNELNNLKCK